MDYLARARFAIAAWFAVLIIALGISIYELWPVIAAGHQRVGYLTAIPLWWSDVAAFLSFGFFFFRHVIQGEELRDLSVEEYKQRRGIRRLIVAILTALSLDMLHTVYQGYDEWAARRRAVTTTGRILTITKRDELRGFTYRGTYQFDAPDGRVFHGKISTSERDGKFDNPFPASVQDALRREQTPISINVQFDPEWPNRHWPADIGRLMDNAPLLVFGGLCNVCQFVFFIVFGAIFFLAIHETKSVPWWRELVGVGPLVIEVVLLSICALISKFG